MIAYLAAHSKVIDQIGINALLAVSLMISLRAGQLALAQVAFMGIAAYAGSLVAIDYAWNLPLSMLAGALCAMAAAALLALPIARLRGVFLAIATIGFGEVARIVEINVPVTGGAEGLANIPNDANTGWIYGTLVLTLAALLAFGRGRWVLALDAVREDEIAARGCGIDVGSVRFGALVAGSGIAGVAGVLYAHANFFITPGDFGFARMEQVLVYSVIGGTTSALGSALGAAAMTLLPEAIRFLNDYRVITTGVLLLVFIVFVPRGLAGLWQRTS
jgi:branched-chain amino acid transport system permease protein